MLHSLQGRSTTTVPSNTTRATSDTATSPSSSEKSDRTAASTTSTSTSPPRGSRRASPQDAHSGATLPVFLNRSLSMVQPSLKRQRSHPLYELLYHPGIPGRGEFIRLAFEAAGVAYTDVANETPDGYNTVQEICMNKGLESAGDNPPVFSPPALRIPGAGHSGQSALVIAQTPNILFYLGERLGLVPEDDEAGRYYVQQLALTALDLNNEVHDTHHPIAVSKYYEDQKEESLKKAQDVRENRIPKFLSYFERTLQHNKNTGDGQGKWLVGDHLTYADTTVWQVIDGCMFAFPKEMKARKEEFPDLLGGFYESIKEESKLKEYLGSKRRLPYSMGVYRLYPELDRQ